LSTHSASVLHTSLLLLLLLLVRWCRGKGLV